MLKKSGLVWKCTRDKNVFFTLKDFCCSCSFATLKCFRLWNQFNVKQVTTKVNIKNCFQIMFLLTGGVEAANQPQIITLPPPCGTFGMVDLWNAFIIIPDVICLQICRPKSCWSDSFKKQEKKLNFPSKQKNCVSKLLSAKALKVKEILIGLFMWKLDSQKITAERVSSNLAENVALILAINSYHDGRSTDCQCGLLKAQIAKHSCKWHTRFK